MAGAADNLRIDGERLWASLMEMAEIGPGLRGGNNRQAVTDEDGAARALLQRWAEAEDLTMTVDQMGAMFLRREGEDPGLPPVCFGSHLDTQPTGGKYDGVLGVLAGLEAIRTLNQMGVRTRHPLMLINWTNEEGSRFAPAMMASGVFAGVISQQNAYDRVDADGVRFEDELRRIGWRGDAPVGETPIAAFFELHIEQGPILEAEGVDIGVVTHGQGVRWLECRITGKESHTGTTPMPLRKDAARGMAQVVELVHQIAMAHQPNGVGTVGHIDVTPNSRNIIAGQAVFTVDFRSPDLAVLTGMLDDLRTRASSVCAALGLSFESEIVNQFDPPAFDPDCVGAVRRAAERLGYAHRDLVSGAGHDACFINDVAPSAMIMCPCVDGLSHNEDEKITPAWAKAGADVLLHAVLEKAEIVS